jgi:hypothetical protein
MLLLLHVSTAGHDRRNAPGCGDQVALLHTPQQTSAWTRPPHPELHSSTQSLPARARQPGGGSHGRLHGKGRLHVPHQPTCNRVMNPHAELLRQGAQARCCRPQQLRPQTTCHQQLAACCGRHGQVATPHTDTQQTPCMLPLHSAGRCVSPWLIPTPYPRQYRGPPTPTRLHRTTNTHRHGPARHSNQHGTCMHANKSRNASTSCWCGRMATCFIPPLVA